MMKTIYTVRLNNGLTAPCDCNYVSIIQGDIIGYMDLRGALRFSTKQEATDALRRLPEQVRHKYLPCSCSIFRPTVREWTLERRK